MKKLLMMLDKLICSYIGIEKEKINPHSLEMLENKIIISSTDSHKRYLHKINMEDFISSHINQINSIDKEKLGLAAGKAIADNLVITFDEISVNE